MAPKATMRVALWQGASPKGDADAALQTIAMAAKSAGAAGATMLVFPELYLPGYNFEKIADLAQPATGHWSRRLAEIAAETNCGLAVGYAEKDGDKLYNATAVVDKTGRSLANYRKIQLFGQREKALFAPGDTYVTFDLNGMKAAVLICYDVEFAQHVAALAHKGVRLILAPTANMAPFHHVPKHTIPALAANHALSIIYANYVGDERDLTYLGESVIAGNDGRRIASAGEGAALLIADLTECHDPARLSQQLTEFRETVS